MTKMLLLTTALVLTPLMAKAAPAPIIAPDWMGVYECHTMQTFPPESTYDRNPVIRSDLTITQDWNSVWRGGVQRGFNPARLSFGAEHSTINGAVYSREVQYPGQRRVWVKDNNVFWSGVSAKDPRLSMLGLFQYNARVGGVYSETIFRGGQMEKRIDYHCTFGDSE